MTVAKSWDLWDGNLQRAGTSPRVATQRPRHLGLEHPCVFVRDLPPGTQHDDTAEAIVVKRGRGWSQPEGP